MKRRAAPACRGSHAVCSVASVVLRAAHRPQSLNMSSLGRANSPQPGHVGATFRSAGGSDRRPPIQRLRQPLSCHIGTQHRCLLVRGSLGTRSAIASARRTTVAASGEAISRERGSLQVSAARSHASDQQSRCQGAQHKNLACRMSEPQIARKSGTIESIATQHELPAYTTLKRLQPFGNDALETAAAAGTDRRER